MDKKNLLAIGLITLLFTVWMIYMSVNTQAPPESAKKKDKKTENTLNDTSKSSKTPQTEDELQSAELTKTKNDSLDALNKYGVSLLPYTKGNEEIITVENDLVVAKISSRGGVIKEWTLKKYKTWNHYPSQLVWDWKGALAVKFASRETGREVDTRDFFFKFKDNKSTNYKLDKVGDSLQLSLVLDISGGRSIQRTYTFYKDKYHVNTAVKFTNFEDILTNKGWKFCWDNGIRYQEYNSVDESNDANGQIEMNGELFDVDATSYDPVSIQKTGVIDFAAVKTKYFAAAILPKPGKSFDGTVTISGQKHGAPDNGHFEKYNLSYSIPYRGGEQSREFEVYMGPTDYKILQDYKLQSLVNFGWRLIVRPIGEFFMLPFFMLIYHLIGNFGISIIVFSIFMKLLLYPLSIQQMRSAQKMQLIAPEMASVREKYKDDQAKQQQEIMKLYSEYGINPAGGCLPLLLQMPILYALWAVLRAQIDLRQAYFGFWIKDLSLPDNILTLPFPIFGISTISGLSLLMGITMFIQQKMTVTDPKQKAMIYMMPIMFVLMFSNFPSGLNLYYFMFNLLSILQQVYINKFSRKKLTLADLKRMPKKEGWFAKKMREASEIAKSQGKTIPGASSGSQSNRPSLNDRNPRKKK